MYDHYIKESLQRGHVQQVAEEERQASSMSAALCRHPIEVRCSPPQAGALGRSEEELGGASSPVPGPERGHGHGTQEGPQGADGGRDEATGEGH